MAYTGQAHEFSSREAAEGSGEADVNTPSPSWEEMEQDRAWCRLLLHEGERGVRDSGTSSMPKFEGETDTEYSRRMERTFLRNFYEEGVKGLVSRMFAKPLLVAEDAPEEVRQWWADIDDKGTPGDNFFQTAAEDAVGQGQTAILPDMPQGFDFTSEQEEERAGVRPRLVNHRAESVIEALEGSAFGMPVIERLRLRRCEATVDGFEYGEKNTVREYVMGEPGLWLDPSADEAGGRFARFRTWTEPEEQADDWTVDEWSVLRPSRKATPEQQRLFLEPLLVPMYAGKIGAWFAKPPLLQCANLNKQHWQKKGDIDNQEHVALVPTMDVEGADAQTVGEVQVGANRIIYHPEGSKVSWLVLDPKALTHARESLRDLEAHILRTMYDPMQQKATGKQLATVRLLDETRPVTLAQAILLNFQWAINRSIDIMCAWVGVAGAPAGQPWVTFQQDVFKDLADPKAGELLFNLAAADPPLLAPVDMYKGLQQLGRLDSDDDPEEMADRLAEYRESVATHGL